MISRITWPIAIAYFAVSLFLTLSWTYMLENERYGEMSAFGSVLLWINFGVGAFFWAPAFAWLLAGLLIPFWKPSSLWKVIFCVLTSASGLAGMLGVIYFIAPAC